MEKILKTKVTFKDASELIAKMFNELEWTNRTNWTGEEVFNASPTGELFHVFEYYQIAKDYFEMDEEERKKLKGMPIPANSSFSFTVPETWRNYKLTEKQMKSIIELADYYKDHPEADKLVHQILIGNEIQTHTNQELLALANYLKGENLDDKEPLPTEKKKAAYVPVEKKKLGYEEVDECPAPYVGLEWTEMYSYYGKVVGRVDRTFAFKWQEADPEWQKALDQPYYIIEDTVDKVPYILTNQQFKEKFSYKGTKGCWVRFKFNPAGREEL